MGNAGSAVAEGFPPKSKFHPDQIPDLTGRVIIVTGGNTGVGKVTVRELLKHNAKVYMASRSKARAEAAIKELKEVTGREAIFLELDLASLASVRKSAEEFLSKEQELHVLFNNAGIAWCSTDLFTADGYDMQFGVNVLGHFLFTELLMPALIAGTKSSPDGHTRIVSASSSVARFASRINWDAFRDSPSRKKMSPDDLYNQSKLLNAVLSFEVARRYSDKGVISVATNPGNIETELQRHLGAVRLAIMKALLLQPVEMGALTQLWAGTMPETLELNGQYLKPWARPGKTRKEAYDPENGKRLWEYLQDQVKQ